MNEYAIRCNDSDVRAILSGAKTELRRPVRPQPDLHGRLDWFWFNSGWRGIVRAPGPPTSTPFLSCPFGQAGDRLWVRECFRPYMEMWRSGIEYRADGGHKKVTRDHVEEMGHRSGIDLRFPGADRKFHNPKWRPSGHMQRWASRITLEVTGVRVERVQAITEAGAKLEGVDASAVPADVGRPHVAAFRGIWNAIYSRKSLDWYANPWVFVVEVGTSRLNARR